MQDKKEIGRKIWELFSKNYTYGEIAKELKVSKSVVSNVINYCMPSKDIYDKSIKEIMQNCEKEKKELQDELYEYCKSIVKRVILQSSVISSILFLVVISFTSLPQKLLNFLHLKNTFILNITALASISIIFFVIVYLILHSANKDEI